MNTKVSIDKLRVEDELTKAAALADILACAGTGEITPKRDTITIVADLLAKAIENASAEIFKPAKSGADGGGK